jgi:hypothetical protein
LATIGFVFHIPGPTKNPTKPMARVLPSGKKWCWLDKSDQAKLEKRFMESQTN